MFADLRRHGLAVSTRGPGGGYMIARALGEITAADIVLAVDRMNADSARGDGACASEGDGRCLTPELWTSLSRCVIEFLDSVSLQKLVDDQPPGSVARRGRTGQAPCIGQGGTQAVAARGAQLRVPAGHVSDALTTGRRAGDAMPALRRDLFRLRIPFAGRALLPLLAFARHLLHGTAGVLPWPTAISLRGPCSAGSRPA